jgi:hypothetical protein
MAVYRIHRMKDNPRQQFRWAPHTSGSTPVKPRDYEPAGEIEAESPYAAWRSLQESEHPLRVGDILESAEGGLRICKYVGFEEARWLVPESVPAEQVAAPTAASPA